MRSQTTLEFLVKLRNIKYGDIVEATGVTKQMVSVWAKGNRPIAEKYFPILSELLNFPADLLHTKLTTEEKLSLKKQALIDECNSYGVSFEDL